MSFRQSHEDDEPEEYYTLKIISYGHSKGPLVVDDEGYCTKLLFSVRDVPNPPKILCKKHTGLSRRLQKEIFASKEGKIRLEDILATIEGQMINIADGLQQSSNEVMGADAIEQSPSNLVVGIMCEEGVHRSVALAEVVGHRIPRNPRWKTEIHHREVQDAPSSEEEEVDELDGGDMRLAHTSRKRSTKSAKKRAWR